MSTPQPAPRVRVAAAIVEDGKILLVKHRKDGEEYWLLPGGGVEFGEPLPTALARELWEETGYEIEVGSLLCLADSISPRGERHIVQICFAARRVGGAFIVCDDPRIVGVDWLPVEALPTLRVFPAFGAEIYAALQGGRAADYLGNRWV